MSLFSPKWKSKDPLKRTKAVSKLKNISVLSEIAENDLNTDVRNAAYDELEKYVDIWVSVTEELSDQSLLFEKISKISGQNTLTRIVKSKYVSRNGKVAVINFLTDQNTLSEIAKSNTSHPELKDAARSKINELYTPDETIKTEKSDIRVADVIEKSENDSNTMNQSQQDNFTKDLENYLADNNVLFGENTTTKSIVSDDISKKKSNDDAKSMTTDEDSKWKNELVEILGNGYTMGELVNWIENEADRNNNEHQKILRNLATKDQSAGIREYAANKVTDIDILCQIILNEFDKLTRMAAVDSLNIMDDYKTLKELSVKIMCKNEQDQDVKNYILDYIK